MRGLLIAFMLLAGPAHAACDPSKGGRAFEIEVERVDLGPADWRGLEHLGTVELSSENTAFGGLSGLLIEESGTRMIAVGDRGRWFAATLIRGADWLVAGVTGATHVRMRGPRGRLDGNRRDAEGMVRLGEDILVSFERVHRVMRCSRGNRMEQFEKLDEWGELQNNGSFESIALLPDGRVMVIAEANDSTRGFPYWVLGGPDGPVKGYLPQEGPHHVTDAAYGPNGILYLIERHYSPLTGVAIRVVRYWPDRTGLPLPPSRELLAEFDSASGIDNMEGLALWTDGLGRLRLTMIADDNFSDIQRTLMVDTVVRRP